MAAAVRRTLTEFKTVAIRRTLRGDLSFITQKQIAELVQLITAGLVLANNKGRKRARIQSRTIKASFIDDALNDPSFTQMNSKALNIVTTYTSNINEELQTFTRSLIQKRLPTNSMILELGAKFDALGVSPTNAYQLENIVRTQAQITYNAAKYKEEQEPYIADILWGYRYSTVGDNRVRDDHAALEGIVLPKDDPFWLKFYPPNGWSCRCQAIPLFEKEKIKRPTKDFVIDDKFSRSPTELLGVQ